MILVPVSGVTAFWAYEVGSDDAGPAAVFGAVSVAILTLATWMVVPVVRRFAARYRRAGRAIRKYRRLRAAQPTGHHVPGAITAYYAQNGGKADMVLTGVVLLVIAIGLIDIVTR